MLSVFKEINCQVPVGNGKLKSDGTNLGNTNIARIFKNWEIGLMAEQNIANWGCSSVSTSPVAKLKTCHDDEERLHLLFPPKEK